MTRIDDIIGGTVRMTEQTLREILNAVEKHKSTDLKEGEELRNPIIVSSVYSNVDFEIDIEDKQNSQESLHYKELFDGK